MRYTLIIKAVISMTIKRFMIKVLGFKGKAHQRAEELYIHRDGQDQ